MGLEEWRLWKALPFEHRGWFNPKISLFVKQQLDAKEKVMGTSTFSVINVDLITQTAVKARNGHLTSN